MLPEDLDIRREGRAWVGGEARRRYEFTPERIELIQGMLFGSADERIAMIALLLENVGVDRVVRLGDPAVWREAVAEL